MLPARARRLAAIPLVALALLGLPSVARAEDLFSGEPIILPREEADRRVKELMRTGFAEYKKAHYEAARDAFAKAWRLEEDGEIAGTLAEVEMRLGRHGDAATHWDYYLSEDPPDRAEALAQLGECKKHVAKLVVAVRGVEAEVRIDGAAVVDLADIGMTSVGSLWLTPGRHALEARAQGEQTFGAKVEVDVVLNQETRSDLPLPPRALRTPSAAAPRAATAPQAATALQPSAAPSAPPSDKSGGVSARAIVTVSGAALTLGALTVAVISSVRANTADSRRQELLIQLHQAEPDYEHQNGICAFNRVDRPAKCTELDAEIETLFSNNKTANAAYVTSGVLGAVTLGTFLLWPSNAKKASAHEHRLVISPLSAAGGQGLLLQGSF